MSQIQHTIAGLLLVTATLTATPLAAQEFKQEAKHVHGAVTLNLALENGLLSVEMEAPAINVVGFERAPRDAAEEKVVRDAAAWLGAGRALLGVPAAAGCRRVEASVEAPKWSDATGKDGGKHDHDHDHDHEHGDDEHAHADYLATASYQCSNPAALAWIEVWALRQLRDVTEVTVNVVTPEVQKSVRTSRADERIALR
ncbi:MAG: DUF2796 domain-containing protein [Steroidobacteraceae bacterium]